MRQPSNQLYLFPKQGSGTHINIFSPKPKLNYLLANNSDGFVEVIEKGKTSPFKKIEIELMHCSLILDGKLLIGS